jgi:hypothetical protein
MGDTVRIVSDIVWICLAVNVDKNKNKNVKRKRTRSLSLPVVFLLNILT